MSRRTRNTPEMLETGRVEAERVAYEMDGPYCDNCGAAGATFEGNGVKVCNEACAARMGRLPYYARTPTKAELTAAIARENAP